MEPNPELMATMSKVLPPMTRFISMLIPGRDSRIAGLNAQNNAEIIQLVAHVSAVLPPPGEQKPLPELVDRCYALGTFKSLWAIEGLGHWYADSELLRAKSWKDLLVGPKAAGLPSKCLTMMHAGIGMSFAKHTLQPLKASSPRAEIRKAVETIIELCRTNSQSGYTGAAIESLGLASRFLHGTAMVQAIDRELMEIDEALAGYLWHGAGRAMYFSPPNFLPGLRTPWRALTMTRTEPPHEMGRRSAAAGFAWAITLVNMRVPEIVETLLAYHGDELARDDAFSNGVMSALIMRNDISPDDAVLAAYRKHRPSTANGRVSGLWDRLVNLPGEHALNQLYPALKERNLLEQVFRYQDLDTLVN
jgi:hypothetical protein